MKPLVIFMHPEDDPTLIDAAIRAETREIRMTRARPKGEAIVLDVVELERQVRRDMERIFMQRRLEVLEEPPRPKYLLGWPYGLTEPIA